MHLTCTIYTDHSTHHIHPFMNLTYCLSAKEMEASELLHGKRKRGTDRSWCRTRFVEIRGTSNCNRCLLVAWEMSDGWLIKASSGIDINGVENFICTFGTLRTIGALILARRRKKQTSIESKGEMTEEGGVRTPVGRPESSITQVSKKAISFLRVPIIRILI